MKTDGIANIIFAGIVIAVIFGIVGAIELAVTILAVVAGMVIASLWLMAANIEEMEGGGIWPAGNGESE